MSLLAIRHGQASFGSADYDRLSTLGWEQSRRLGGWLADHAQRYAHVVCGTMRRHRETLQAVSEAFAARELSLPSTEFNADLNEFDHGAVIQAFLRAHPQAKPVVEGSEKPPQKAVMQLLMGALSRWADGAFDDELDEGWHAFGERVLRGGDRLHALLADGPVLLVSSGGTLSRLALHALDSPPARAVELNLSLRNTGLCEFHALGGALRMGSWNALPHLASERGMWTHY